MDEKNSRHDATIKAVEAWVNAEYSHAANIGKGGPGYPDKCEKAERKAREAIAELAKSAQEAQGEGLTDDAKASIYYLEALKQSLEVARDADYIQEIEFTRGLKAGLKVAIGAIDSEVRSIRVIEETIKKSNNEFDNKDKE